jgi:hypothetical protein
MTRRLGGAAVATVAALALAGVAAADHGGARTYRATLAKTAAADAAQLPDVHGKAQLVDGKKHNKISIHVRGLKPGETYPWHIHKARNATDDPCAPNSPAADPTPYGDWNYHADKRPLKANDAGAANAKGTSATFDSRTDPGPYYVNVHLLDGTVIACGVLKTKAKKAHAKSKHTAKSSPPRKTAQGEAHGQGPKSGRGAAG